MATPEELMAAGVWERIAAALEDQAGAQWVQAAFMRALVETHIAVERLDWSDTAEALLSPALFALNASLERMAPPEAAPAQQAAAPAAAEGERADG